MFNRYVNANNQASHDFAGFVLDVLFDFEEEIDEYYVATDLMRFLYGNGM